MMAFQAYLNYLYIKYRYYNKFEGLTIQHRHE